MKRRNQSIIALTAGFLFLFSIPVFAGVVEELQEFYEGKPAVAKQVNDNFKAVKSAVDGNAADISANTDAIDKNATNINKLIEIVDSPATTRTISIPAKALSFPVLLNTITVSPLGLRWLSNNNVAASVALKAPADYAGGDVSFSIFFETTTATTGIVAFYISPTSFNSGDALIDVKRISSSVSVSGAGGGRDGNLYQQNITIPAGTFDNDWWALMIYRGGINETYYDDVIVAAIALEYSAVQPPINLRSE